MSLPILHSSAASDDDLVRFYHKTELHWARHMGEEERLDIGTAIINPKITHVWNPNRMLDVALPEGMTPERAYAEVEDLFRSHGTRCREWALAPGEKETRTKPMAEYLLAHGYIVGGHDILHLARQPSGSIQEVSGLTIIPARASYRHVRELAAEAARESAMLREEEAADDALTHLDDPHVDSLLALKDGKPVAAVGVLAVGEIGAIEDLYVAAPHRNQGIGRTMMSRAMEICARSLFKHILIGVDGANAPAMALYTKFGFRRIGRYTDYQRSP